MGAGRFAPSRIERNRRLATFGCAAVETATARAA